METMTVIAITTTASRQGDGAHDKSYLWIGRGCLHTDGSTEGGLR